MIERNFRGIIVRRQRSKVSRQRASSGRSLEGDQGGTSLDAGRMSYSTVACFPSAVCKPKRSSRKSAPQNFLGGAAIACLVLGSAWTVYTNVFRADVYPHLDSANFDAPVVKRPAAVAQSAPPAADRVAAAFSELAPLTSAPTRTALQTTAASDTLSFGDRFAAAAPQGVEPTRQPEAPKLAEAPKPQPEKSKLAEAPKPKEAAPVQLAAISPQ